MQCTNCGNTLQPTAAFCNNCGQRVAQTSQETQFAGQGGPPPPGMPAGAGGPAPYPGGGPPPYAGPPPYGPGGGRRAAPALDLTATLNRLTRLLKFDTTVFREARADRAALIPGFIVAGVSILIMALGAWLWAQFKLGDGFDSGRFFLRSVIFGTLIGVGAWAGWVAITSFLLQQMFKRQVDIPSMFGPLGLAAAPLAIGLLAMIDIFFLAFALAGIAGAVMLTQIALQETTDASPGEVFAANLAGFAVFALVLVLLGREDANLAPGIFGFNAYSS